MQPIPGDPELLHHYSVFLYPFRHHISGRKRHARLASLEPRWLPWPARFGESELTAAVEGTGFFLPHIHGVLFPDVARLEEETPSGDCGQWVKVLRAWSAAGCAEYARDLPAAGVLRLTLRSGLVEELHDILVVQPRCHGGYATEAVELPCRCGWIDAVLFPSGLGFLLLNVRLTSEQPRLSELIRLNQALRQVHPSRHEHAPVLRLAGGEELTVHELMSFLVQGLAVPWHIPEEERGLFLVPAAGPCWSPAGAQAGRGYGERCYLVSYGCVDLANSTQGDLPPGPFDSAADRLLFEYATCIGLGESVNNPVWAPTRVQAEKVSRDNRLAFWRCWTGMVLKESLVFLGTEDLGFTRRSLPRHIENDYLMLYLFTLYQKLQLCTFAADLMHEVAQSGAHLRQARALLERFVAFRSQYWFNEVTRKPQGGELYRTFQHGLEVQSSYDMVTGSIKDVKDYYESVWARQMQLFKDAITFGGPVTMAFGAVRMIVGESRHTWTIGGLMACFLLLLVAWRVLQPRRWLARRRRSRRSQSSHASPVPALWRVRRQDAARAPR